jgi:excisionase family DNA binding protein
METTEKYPNLLSEKQAAKRLGIARITLLRAREAGRIRFFRIGTRVLYSEAQLIQFLDACERNSCSEKGEPPDAQEAAAKRKDNQVSAPKKRRVNSSPKSLDENSHNGTCADQVVLPFSATG